MTLVSAMKGVHDCLTAADELAAKGVSAEVIDLRTIRPIDLETIMASLAKTNRLAVVEEGPLTGGWAGEVLALVDRAGPRRHRRRLADHHRRTGRSPTARRSKTPSCRRLNDRCRRSRTA